MPGRSGLPRATALLIGAVLFVPLACASPRPTTPSPATPDPSLTPVPVAQCRTLSFDRSTSLPAELSEEAVPEVVVDAQTQRFVDGLAGLYAGTGGVDPCALFTAGGWAAAQAADRRLREAVAGRTRFDERHAVRIFNESENVAAARPPRVSGDLIFDIEAGATALDVATATRTSPSAASERTGFRVTFVFDGGAWLVSSVGPVSIDGQHLLVLRHGPPVQPRCARFERATDPDLFDDRDNRVWCDADGRGRQILVPEQLTFATRFPCERGHAAILVIGRPLGDRIDPLVPWEYVRDPAGEFAAKRWLRGSYDGDAALSQTAAYTGWTNGNIELWIDPAQLDDGIFIVHGGVVERWGRAAEQWGVTDCN